MSAFSIPGLAEIVGPELPSFEQRLQGQMELIVWLYGAVFVTGLCLLIAFTLRVQDRPLSWAEPVRRLEWRPWNWRDAVGIFVPLVLLQVLFALLFSVADRYFGLAGDEPEKILLIAQSLLFHWAGFILVFAALRRHRMSWQTAFGLHRPGWLTDGGWGVLILLGVMPLILGYNVVSGLVLEWLGHEPGVQDVTRIISESTGPAAKLYLALLALVIAPVVEELLFRGVLLPALARVAGVKPAIVAVSLLFAAVHGHWPSFVPLFMLSVAFCLAYTYRGTLVTSIAMHSCFNALTIVVVMQV